MKLQYLSVIFVIIILPISLVVGFYTRTQMDVIRKQTSYTAKLNDATYDAVKSFQLNTTNSYYSSISDSKIRDIEASVNTFYNSLTASLNYTKKDLQGYVPALVYTLYDGYYIYGKRYNVYYEDKADPNKSNIARKGGDDAETKDELINVKIDTNLENAYKYEYGLKPFVYYSCRYKLDDQNDFVVNFTLDNFITIYGTIKGKYITKSGYLINISDDYCKVKFNSSGNITEFNSYKGAKIEGNEILKEYLKFAGDTEGEKEFGDGEYPYVVYENRKIYIKQTAEKIVCFSYDKGIGREITSKEIIDAVKNSVTYSAINYYKEAWKFSKWVDENIGKTKQSNIVDGQNLEYDAGNTPIFELKNQDPEDPASIFNQHKSSVIKNSIITNLIAAINSYNNNSVSYAYALPKLKEEDWEKVVNNVCIISFMQGLPMGGKYFNNYAVVPNDKNNEFVDIDSIYLVTADGQYHLPNCPLLVENQISSLGSEAGYITKFQDIIIGGYINTSFQKQTLDEKYYYKHVRNGNVNTPCTACYQCIVNSSGKYKLEDIVNGNNSANRNLLIAYNSKGEQTGTYNIETLRKKYLTVLAREKYNLYKTTK